MGMSDEARQPEFREHEPLLRMRAHEGSEMAVENGNTARDRISVRPIAVETGRR